VTALWRPCNQLTVSAFNKLFLDSRANSRVRVSSSPPFFSGKKGRKTRQISVYGGSIDFQLFLTPLLPLTKRCTRSQSAQPCYCACIKLS